MKKTRRCPSGWDLKDEEDPCPYIDCTECLAAPVLYDDFRHLGCPAYPCCEDNPNGCSVVMGDDVEWYGHRD